MGTSTFFIIVLMLSSRFLDGRADCITTNRETCRVEIDCNYDIMDFPDSLSLACKYETNECDDYGRCYNQYHEDENYFFINIENVDLETNPLNLERSRYANVLTLTITEGTTFPGELFEFSNLQEVTIVNSLVNEIELNKFTNLPILSKLNASHNSISTLIKRQGFNTISNLNNLDFSYNLIKSIPNNYFSLFSKLQYLNLAHNKITNLDILTFESLSELQILDISYNQLLEIGHSFVRFINVKKLYLDHNNLTSIVEPNLKTMTQLEILNLNANKINNIEDNAFQSLSMLEILDLSSNRLLKINKSLWKENHNLHTLFLLNNNITKIDSEAFKENKFIKLTFSNAHLEGVIVKNTFAGAVIDKLDLSGGSITDLESEAFAELQVRSLNLSFNELKHIEDASFKKVLNLSELDLSNNKLEILGFDTSDLDELEMLNAQKNKIRNITREYFKHLTALVKLNLSYNAISEVEAFIFSDQQKLEYLDMSNNIFLSTLNSGVFQGLSSVKNIDLSHTRLTSILNETFSDLQFLEIFNCSHGELRNVEYNAFKNVTLLTIDLSYNLLEYFFLNSTSITLVEEINLENNQINNITKETFLGLFNLKYLILRDNNIIYIHPQALRSSINLRILDFSSNPLQAVNNFENLSHLESVYLVNIEKVVSFEHSSNTTIKELNLSSNNIENITSLFIFKVKDIRLLDLSNNKIIFVDRFSFQNTSTLVSLDLSLNLISFIQPGSFLQANNIRTLNLHGNLLQKLQYGTLDGLKKLESLNLSNNSITDFNKNLLHATPQILDLALDNNIIQTIEFDSFDETHLRKITVGGNLISCHVFADTKIQNYKFTISTEKLDFHSENFNGIKCKSNNNIDKNIVWSLNTTDINSTDAIFAFTAAIENFQISISKAILNLSSSINDESKHYTENNMTSVLQEILKTNNGILTNNNISQVVMNEKLTELINTLIITNNRSMLHALAIEKYLNESKSERDRTILRYPNINVTDDIVDSHLQEKIQMLNLEKEKMIDEIRAIFQNLKNEQSSFHNEAPTREIHGFGDIRALLYVVVICFTLMIIMFVIYFLYKFSNTKKHIYRNNSINASIQPLTNSLELQST